MFDEKKLWSERFSKRMKELARYSRYIFNGHIVIVIVFLLGTLSYYYQEWLKTVPEQFPAAFIMAIILGLFVTYSPISIYLTEADRIFLLPLENRLSGYFLRSILVSLFSNAVILFMILGVFMPLYAKVSESGFDNYFPFLLAILFVKAINLFIRWRVQFFTDKKYHVMDSIVRYAVNTVFLFLLFSSAGLIFQIPEILLLMILWFFYYKHSAVKGLKWEFLIEQEEKRMNSFYRLANMFTDVPKLGNQVKRRKWLDWVFSKLPFEENLIYSHLYSRAFLRAGDYFGLFIRLTIICIGMVYFLPFGLGQVIVSVLFLYLTGFQLIPLWNHHQNKLWMNLYPIKNEFRIKAFKRLLSQVLYMQAIIVALSILIKGDWLASIISLLVGISFIIFFSNIYVSKKTIQK